MGRKAVWLSVIALAVGLTLAAQEGGAKAMTMTGRLVSVDVKSSTVVVKPEADAASGRDVSFSVGAKTKILKDGKPVALTDLKAGDQLTIEYESVSGKNVALAIGVVPQRTA
jgi:hypothetical protein